MSQILKSIVAKREFEVALRKPILLMGILGSALLLMGHTPPPTAPPPSKLFWSQDGEHIVFSTSFQGIYVVDVAGTRLWTIPERMPVGNRYNPGNYAPDLSPDGSRVAYVTNDKYELLSLLFLDVASPNSLDTALNTIREFFSLDIPEVDSGYSRLDFLAARASSPVIYSMYGSPTFKAAIETSSIDGTEVQRLTAYKDLNGDGEIDKHTEVDPVWSPDGKQIAFKSNQSVYSSAPDATEQGLRLSIMNADGSNVRVLAPSVFLLASERASLHSGSRPPVWSPDGKWIAFVGWGISEGEVEEQRHILYTVRPSGSGLTRIAETLKYGVLAWSPDSSLLAFAAPESEGEEVTSDALFTVRPDGSGLTKIAGGLSSTSRVKLEGDHTLPVESQTVWSPDGAELRPLLTGQVGGRSHFESIAWSPDGSRLAVLGWSEEQTGFTLHTVEPDSGEKHILARQVEGRFIAENTDWHESPRNTAACAEGVVVPEPIVSPGLVRDCETLLGIRDILMGDSYLGRAGYVNWSTDEPISKWDGIEIGCPLPLGIANVLAWQGVVEVCPSADRVIGVQLSGMFGEIPTGIDGLTGLKTLSIKNGALWGGIPPQLANLANLEELRLDRTLRSVEIPPELGRLSNLRVLSLKLNFLTGSIPPELGNLKKLEELSLGVNELGGEIPPELGKLVNLRVLSLSSSFRLSGGIPSELGNLESLEVLSIGGFNLSGQIPGEIGSLSRLKVLLLEHSPFGGRIPAELGNLSELRVLSLAGVGLTGSIPPELKSLTRLRVLSLRGNRLTGTIPRWIGNFGELEELYLAYNSLSGPIPRELGKLSKLQTLSLMSNELTGSIPTELGNLDKLWGLHISYNSLSGCIPSALSQQILEIRSRELEYCTD